eukprot:COSAG01_NODE_53166_length_341_cov_0.648760_2_plen_25_part_01
MIVLFAAVLPPVVVIPVGKIGPSRE